MTGLKLTALRALRALGAFGAVARSRWRSERLLILCYHGLSFSDEHEWNPNLYMTADRFRERLRCLTDVGCTALPLREALERLERGTLPPRAVAITFDDGTTDFARLALPALQAADMPVTLYLTTYYSEHRFPVFTMALSYLLWRGRGSGRRVAGVVPGDDRLSVATPGEREATWTAIHRWAKDAGLNGAQKDQVLRSVAHALDISYDECFGDGQFFILSPDEVRALPADRVQLSLHTHRHWTPRDHGAFTREVTQNAESLRAMVGARAVTADFCYPSGQYWGEFPGWLAELDVRSATTCLPGLASRGASPYLLPRLLDDSRVPDLVFEAWATGVADLLPRRAELRLDPARLRAAESGRQGAVGAATV